MPRFSLLILPGVIAALLVIGCTDSSKEITPTITPAPFPTPSATPIPTPAPTPTLSPTPAMQRLEVILIEYKQTCGAGGGTAGNWIGNEINVTTKLSTPDPCFDLLYPIRAYLYRDTIAVNIYIFPKGEACIQCTGEQEINYKILVPEVEATSLKLIVQGWDEHELVLELQSPMS